MSAREAIALYRHTVELIDHDLANCRVEPIQALIRRQWLVSAILRLESELVTL